MRTAVSHFKAVVYCLIVLVWTVSAFAAEPVLAVVPNLTDIPLRALVAAVFLSMIGGAARMAQKLADPTIEIKSVRLAIAADLMTSIAVGMATFFLVAWREFPPLLQAFVITIAGFGGTKFLESYVTNIVKRFGGANANP